MLHCGRDGELACYLLHFHLNQNCCRKKTKGFRKQKTQCWFNSVAAHSCSYRRVCWFEDEDISCREECNVSPFPTADVGALCIRQGVIAVFPPAPNQNLIIHRQVYTLPSTMNSAGTKVCLWRKEVGAILLFLNLLIGDKVDVFSLSLTLHRICNCQPARLWLHSAAVAAAALAKRRWTVLIKIRMHKQLQQGWNGVFI